MYIKTTAEQTSNHIKKAIFEGKFLPGSRLKEDDISKWLEVSRTPIREAFRLLEAEGVVKIISNRGVFVNLISAEELDDFCELRSLLELYCIRKFVSILEERHIHDLEELANAMIESISKKDYSRYFDISVNFHRYCIDNCNNSSLSSIYSLIENSIRCAQFVLDKSEAYYKKNIREHIQVIEAVKAGNANRAEDLLRQHLQNGYQVMKKNLMKLERS
jgi:DNA-binding GntR family transcriptional regulator